MASFQISIENFLLGLLPYADNFPSIRGFISGFLLGSVLLSSPNSKVRKVAQKKGGLLDYDLKSAVKLRLRLRLKLKLDRPVYRSVAFVLIGVIPR